MKNNLLLLISSLALIVGTFTIVKIKNDNDVTKTACYKATIASKSEVPVGDVCEVAEVVKEGSKLYYFVDKKTLRVVNTVDENGVFSK